MKKLIKIFLSSDIPAINATVCSVSKEWINYLINNELILCELKYCFRPDETIIHWVTLEYSTHLLVKTKLFLYVSNHIFKKK